MKRITSIASAILLISTLFLHAENLDIKTRQLIRLLGKTGLAKCSLSSEKRAMLRHFPIVENQNQESCAPVLLKVDPAGFNENAASECGIRIRSRIGDIYSAAVPVAILHRLSGIEGVEWVELARPARLRLDVSRLETGTNRVTNGESGLEQAYTGEGCIVGIIDTGIDFTHPDFLHPDGSTRIISIWDQFDDSGTSPAIFGYGSEYSAPQINAGNCPHQDAIGHGTHVMGIAASDGSGLSNRGYQGIAPDADLVCVAVGWQTTSIIDAANYIIQKAAGRPVVINMSLGTHEGPHDGTSLLDQAFDNMIGQGQILVGAAGNEAMQFVHTGHTLNQDSLFACFAAANDSLNYIANNVIDIWGQSNSDMNIALLAVDATGRIRFRRESRKETTSLESFDDGSDIVASYMIGYEKSSLNGHPHYNIVGFFYDSANQYDWYVKFSGKGTFDAWTEDNPFGVNFKPSKPGTFPYSSAAFLPGDNTKSVGEIGGTAQGVISVGAYTTKNTWVNYLGEKYQFNPMVEYGAVAPFSSHGPTRDGRMKPEIAAPGNIVVSCLSKDTFEELIDPVRLANLPSDPFLAGGYVGYEGTSMAAPHITGAIALMLQANPALEPADIKLLLSRHARHDSFTGATASDSWGYGKADIFELVNASETYADVSASRMRPKLSFELENNYPNPFNQTTSIGFTLANASQVSLDVYDCRGRLVDELISGDLQAKKYSVKFDASHLASGIYFYKLSIDNDSKTKKLILIK
ncbi:S8 family peptidase [candidate division KSB1 bacterium]|nr:S8 family peptidase [candidate division KSB1 bacterium]